MKVTIERHKDELMIRLPEAVVAKHGLAVGARLELIVSRGELRLARTRRPRGPIGELVNQLDPAAYRRRANELRGF